MQFRTRLKLSNSPPSRWSSLLAVAALALFLTNCGQSSTSTTLQPGENKQKIVADYWPKREPTINPDPAMEKEIETMLSRMTLAQKVAQMIQPEIRDITVADMRQYGFGSYLNGGGSFPAGNKHATPAEWIDLAEAMYQASIDDSLDGSTIPTMWGTDAVHGHGNVIGATLFPHNIGLGATHNPQLIEQVAAATAEEVMVTGIDWVFAPTVAVVRDDRWGRTYEGYSEDPEIVKSYASSVVKGLQGAINEDFLEDHRVIATLKHFLGDGGTQNGDDQGNNLSSDKELYQIHAQGYYSGLDAGAQTVMASFNSWHGKKNHGNYYLLTQILKQRMAFDGLIVGDWNGHGQVESCSNESCPQSVNAGLDIFMVPTKAWKPLLENTIAQVKSGEIKMSRIDDAVSRILRVKMRAGLFTKPSPANRPLSGKTELIGSKAHRTVARQAVRESLVLLKNKNHILPLSQHQRILIAGDAANNIGKQSGGWSITWQGTGNSNDEFPGGTSILAGIKNKLVNADGHLEYNVNGHYQQKPDVAVVVFGETPYAEGDGDIANLEYQRGNKKDLALLKRLKSEGIPVVSVFISGRPLWVNAELNASDAFVAAWLPGTEGAGIADVLIAKPNGQSEFDFTGKLSFSWPNNADQTNINRFDSEISPLFPYGYGLKYADKDTLRDNLNESHPKSTNQLATLNLLRSPWRPAFYHDGDVEVILSSSESNQEISYKTIDRIIQEDARMIQFAGKSLATFEINDNFPFDLRGYAETNSALSFDINISNELTKPLMLKMRCQDYCQKNIDLSKALVGVKLDTWNKLAFNLGCFTDNSVAMGKIFSPFGLSSEQLLQVKISNVRIIANVADTKSVSCQ